MSENSEMREGDKELNCVIEKIITSQIISEEEKTTLFRRALQMIEQDGQGPESE